jgi:putative zinc finger/helix-turn-helix YgiT family protein
MLQSFRFASLAKKGVNNMKGVCPFCEKKKDLEPIKALESIEVRGELIEVDVHYLKCLNCSNTFDDPSTDYDPLQVAYKEYRKRHMMIQPEEIRNFRKRYGLTQAEFSGLLGLGVATLHRYENGALQSEAHEKTLRLSMDPKNFLDLIQEAPTVLNNEKRNRLIKELQAEEAEAYSFERTLEIHFGRYDPDEFSGYRRLELSKLFNAILFFCKGEGIPRTKLNKLLFYADFKHFKEYAVSITGAQYAQLPYGPVLNNYDHYFATLIGNGALTINETEFPDGFVVEQFFSSKEPDLSLFSDSELKVLVSVKDYFKDVNAKDISRISHEEQGYKDTADNAIISYKYAEKLRI